MTSAETMRRPRGSGLRAAAAGSESGPVARPNAATGRALGLVMSALPAWTWRGVRRVAATSMSVGVLLLVTAAPARADNCSGLSDCSLAARIGISAAIGLAVVLLFAAAVEAFAPAVVLSAADAGNIQALETLIAGVNPTGALNNCGWVAQAVADRLAGEVAAYANPFGVLVSDAQLEFGFGGSLQATTELNITESLGAVGNGSTALVQIEGATFNHVLNAVQIEGTTFFVDGQLGQAATSLAQLYPGSSIGALNWIPILL